MNLLPNLKQHLSQYPAMTAQDCAKLLYQAVLGPKHLGSKGTPKAEYIAKEMASAPKRDIPLTQSIGNGICRLHLDSIHCQLRPETIQTLFVKTMESHQGTLEQLQEQLDRWQASSLFPAEEAQKEIQKLAESNFAPVSHSETYRQAYAPHYRLIKEDFAPYLPLLNALDQRLSSGEKTFLAIDGRCGSGKTTLAQLLHEIYGCPVIHMDQFFLPFERKTPERLAEPGGNLDRERFHEEIILPYKAAQPLSYGVYDCTQVKITQHIELPASPLLIAEGSYSLHPLYQDTFDLKVFLTCSPEEQSARILKRNGEALHRRFLREWIPMEEQYFSAFSIPEHCDFVIETKH